MDEAERKSGEPRGGGGGWASASFVLPLILLAVLGAGFMRFVDLTPQVSPTFFFAEDDPAMKESVWIWEHFDAANEMLVLAMRSPDIASEAYLAKVGALSERVLGIPHVLSVQSLTRGPGDLETARESPLWSRLLLGDAESATLAIVFHRAGSGPKVVPAVEALVDELGGPDFDVMLSGAPYVIEQIRHHLEEDLRTFTVASFGIFALLVLVIFRSLWILAGTVVASIGAVLATLVLQVAFGGSIGILTANVATIVTVITLSHVVFLTANLRGVSGEARRDATAMTAAAVRITFPASLWCATTTLLGFVSLVFVEAQPLQDLGLSGSVGTAAALVCSYLLFPPFMIGHARGLARNGVAPARAAGAGAAGSRWVSAAVAGSLVCVALGLGLGRLQTDPSLLSYFEPEQPLREGLDYVDRTLGSSPLSLVVSDAAGGVFEGREILERQWALHQEFEAQESVGGALSLPILIGEGRRVPLIGKLLPLDWIVDLLGRPVLGEVGDGFVTPDRKHAQFMLTMRESGLARPRLEVVEELRGLAAANGFEATAIGGLYYLQGHLGQMVRSSLIFGVASLLGLFFLVGLAAARSLKTSAAMVGSIALVPIATLGLLGLTRTPIDVISSPASNVCIGMAADAMIHLVLAMRRHAAGHRPTWADWIAARREQAVPIVTSAVLVISGFAIFTLSAFPPTRRFGAAVVFGTLVAAFGALVLLPALAGPRAKAADA